MRRSNPRIYYTHPPLVGALAHWPPLLDRCAELGFDHVAISPPFAPGGIAGVFAPEDPDRPHPCLGNEDSVTAAVARLAAACRERALGLVVDVVVHQVAAGRSDDGADDLPDPRREPQMLGARAVDFGSDAGRTHLAAWSRRVAALAEAGAAAIGVHAAHRMPPEALGALRAALPEPAWLLAYAPQATQHELEALGRAGVDAVVASIDGRGAGGGLLQEREGQSAVPRSIAAPELPFGRRLAAEHADGNERQRAARQALRLCAGMGDGILVPMGFERAARRAFNPRAGLPEAIRRPDDEVLVEEIRALTRLLAEDDGRFAGGAVVELTDPGDTVVAMLRADAGSPHEAERARLVLANRNLAHGADIEASGLLRLAGGTFGPFKPVLNGAAGPLSAGDRLHLEAGEVRIAEAVRAPEIRIAPKAGTETALAAAAAPRLAIEKVEPTVAGGFPVKRVVGDVVDVEADLFTDGHEKLLAMLLWRAADEEDWRETAMTPLGNDRWHATFPLQRMGRYYFCVETWVGPFETSLSGLTKKHDAGVPVSLEIEEGRRLVERWAKRGRGGEVAELSERMNVASEDERLHILLDPATERIMAKADPRRQAVRSAPAPVEAERIGAEFASWYEIFPRSQAKEPGRHGTLIDVIDQLPRIRDMGFDVLYFPPIHPIGRTNRKGRNNSLQAGPDDPGSPYAIGSEHGGHDALHPELGTFDDLEQLRQAAAAHGIELAIDFAIQCAPDHPWIKEHPEWFDWRPDGTIKFAENPPKKYEDIVNVDFYLEGAIPSLWIALRDVVLFWVDKGIKLFRVDNPHTKPYPFWEWLIGEVRAEHPDTVFLSEAFTRPKVMYRLAKIGFSQSYTYFTWRTQKWEFEQYLTELTRTEARHVFRPHFFVNTPDINPPYLHSGERPYFLCRATLAATLSGLWGVYNGFELCEGRPLPGKEEYLNSEKYEIRHWDYDRPGNIVGEITQLNRIRRENPALRSHHGVTFLNAWNDNVLFYVKQASGGRNTVLCAVNMAPTSVQEADVELPHHLLSLPDHAGLAAEDLMRGHRFTWHGRWQRIRLEPDQPFAIWRVTPATNS